MSGTGESSVASRNVCILWKWSLPMAQWLTQASSRQESVERLQALYAENEKILHTMVVQRGAQRELLDSFKLQVTNLQNAIVVIGKDIDRLRKEQQNMLKLLSNLHAPAPGPSNDDVLVVSDDEE